MTRVLATILLALSAPVAAHACDIYSTPVSQDEVQAAGLGPLLAQADKELAEATSPAGQALYSQRMVMIATAARCGSDAAREAEHSLNPLMFDGPAYRLRGIN